jgi:short-subunit dehydrogenase
VIVYGATNNVGKQVSKVLAKHGYSLVLIDVNLDKLQQVKNDLIRIFPHITQVAED